MAGKRLKKTRQPPHVHRFVADYVKVHPCFYEEALQTALRQRFGAGTSGFSASAFLRLLKFDLGLSKKVLERRAREAVPREIEDFMANMMCWYKYPEQLVFVDETSKNGLDSMRRYAWLARGSRAAVRVPFSRGNCSLLNTITCCTSPRCAACLIFPDSK
ncbi:putative transposase [Phytophthora cinnamomi]|uniref:putative transposase n=1 Tax=Phytophthora cinnamomi TaxID=4785 RepID=UPI0035599DF8|nr:putative transposase [Phytophthora cinnamomi]